MPIAESSPAATLAFDAAVHRAHARRLSDTPYPHNQAATLPAPAHQAHPAGARPDRMNAQASAD